MSTVTTTDEKLLGTNEVAVMLGVKPRTVGQWRWRQKMPTPDEVFSGNPAWRRSTIILWAGATSRLHDPALITEYRRLSGQQPKFSHPRDKLTPIERAEILASPEAAAGGELPKRALAEKYGVTERQIYRILNGK